MVMPVSRFVAELKRIRAHLAAAENPSEELTHAAAQLARALASSYTPDELKRTLAAGESVSSELEEGLTSALVLLNRDRATGRGSD